MEISILFHSQEMEFLGISVNTIQMSFSYPHSKVVRLQNECIRLLSSRSASQSNLANFNCKMIVAKAAVFQAPLHYRVFQLERSYGSLPDPIAEQFDALVQPWREDAFPF